MKNIRKQNKLHVIDVANFVMLSFQPFKQLFCENKRNKEWSPTPRKYRKCFSAILKNDKNDNQYSGFCNILRNLALSRGTIDDREKN